MAALLCPEQVAVQCSVRFPSCWSWEAPQGAGPQILATSDTVASVLLIGLCLPSDKVWCPGSCLGP